jgi:putative ABC transport system permease protein
VSGSLYLAWRYLVFHRWKTSILVTSIALIAYIPAGLKVLVDESARGLMVRAESTPLVVGGRGSPLELVLSSLYFETRTPAALSFAEADRIARSGLADPIPLHIRFRVGEQPVVGTELGYFDMRGLRLRAGRMLAGLGECLLGAEAARTLEAAPGDRVISSPESVFDLAGAYPLRMRVVGVLKPSHTPDDQAVFVDVKTAWVMEGLGHGHADLTQASQARAILSRDQRPEGERIVANASVREWNEITPENESSFHFHGDPTSYPLTAVIAVPRSDKQGVLLQGRYASPDSTNQILRPRVVMDELLGTVFRVRGWVMGALLLVSIATLATAGLVFALSLRLRRREIQTLSRIGASRSAIAVILAGEMVAVVALGCALAMGLTLLTRTLGEAAILGLLAS